MPITLRPLQLNADAAAVAALLSLTRPAPVTVAQLHEWERGASAGRVQRQIVACDEGGVMLGYGAVRRNPWEAAGRWRAWLVVDVARRGAGIGGRLWAALRDFVAAQGGGVVGAEVSDADGASLAFAERRGATIERHIFELVLAVAEFDAAPFADVLATVAASGISFLTMADFDSSPAAQRQLYELHSQLLRDVPGFGDGGPPFEQFVRERIEASWYRADGQFIAADGATWAGLAMLGHFPTTNTVHHMLTGTLPAYRGRRIALALKLLSVAYAQRIGAQFLRTDNDSQNAPMLRINRTLGYQPAPGTYRLACPVDAPAGASQ